MKFVDYKKMFKLNKVDQIDVGFVFEIVSHWRPFGVHSAFGAFRALFFETVRRTASKAVLFRRCVDRAQAIGLH